MDCFCYCVIILVLFTEVFDCRLSACDPLKSSLIVVDHAMINTEFFCSLCIVLLVTLSCIIVFYLITINTCDILLSFICL